MSPSHAAIHRHTLKQARILTKVRWWAIFLLLTLVLVAWWQDTVSVRLATFSIGILLAMAAINGLGTVLYNGHQKGKIPRRYYGRLVSFSYFHSATDLLFIFAIIHLTGGPYSPAFLLLPIYLGVIALNYSEDGTVWAFVSISAVLWIALRWLYFKHLLSYNLALAPLPVTTGKQLAIPRLTISTVVQVALMYATAALVLVQSKRLKEWWDRSRSQHLVISKLHDLGTAGLKSRSLPEAANTLAAQVAEMLEADSTFIAIWEPERQCIHPLGAYGCNAKEFLSKGCYTPGEELIHQTKPFWLPIERLNQILFTPEKGKKEGFKAGLALPLHDPTTGEFVGMACVGYLTKVQMSEQMLEWLPRISTTLSLLISKSIAAEQKQQHLLLLQNLSDHACYLSTLLDKEQILISAVEGGKKLLKAYAGSVLTFSSSTQKAECLYKDALLPSDYVQSVLANFRSTPIFALLLGEKEVIIPDMANCNLPNEIKEKALNAKLRAMATFPMLIAKGTLGMITFYWNEPHYLTEEERAVGKLWANRVGTAIYNASLYESLRRESMTDPLTDLLNRRALDKALMQEWKRAERYKRPFAVVMIDVDNFKTVNDSYGHLVGDNVLKNMATLLSQTLRETDIIGRWGGDEFLVILPETGKEEAQIVLEKLYNSMVHAPSLSAFEIELTFSFGTAVYPDDADNPEDLVSVADKRMYSRKFT